MNESPIFECHDWAIFNKPCGISVQDYARILKAQYPNIHPCHRLDKETSGLWLVAFSEKANQYFSSAFQNKHIHKVYIALTDKKPKKKQGKIVGDMDKSRRGQWKLLHTKDNPAITYFKSEGFNEGNRLNFCFPVSGKTHQIRVALKSNGTPILGDELYAGSSSSDRMYLHAFFLSFQWCGVTHQFHAYPEQGALWQALPTISLKSLKDKSSNLGVNLETL